MLDVVMDIKRKNVQVNKLVTDLKGTYLNTTNKMVWFNYREKHKKTLMEVMKFYLKLQKEYDAKEYFSSLVNYTEINLMLNVLDSKDTSIETSKHVLGAILKISRHIAKVLDDIETRLAMINKATDNILIHNDLVKEAKIKNIPLKVGQDLYRSITPTGVYGLNKFYINLLGTSAKSVYEKTFEICMKNDNAEMLTNRGLMQSVRNLQKRISY